MLQGSCDFAVPASLDGIVQVTTFTDTDNGRNYCLLMEVRDRDRNGFVDHGFGTFIVYQPRRPPVEPPGRASHRGQYDRDPGCHRVQGHRLAQLCDGRRASRCQRRCEHVSAVLPGVRRLAQQQHDGPGHQRGVARLLRRRTLVRDSVARDGGLDLPEDGCLSLSRPRCHTGAPPTRSPSCATTCWCTIRPGEVDLPGSGACSLNATENVQGRLLNGVAADSVCGTEASSYTQRFLHIEQDPNFRTPSDWIAPITEAFP